MSRYVLRRLLFGVLVLAAVTFVSALAQDLAYRSRANQPAPIQQVTGQAVRDSVDSWRRLLQGDLGRYTTPTTRFRWQRTQLLSDLIGPLVGRSLALLLISMLFGGLVGGTLGLMAAAVRRRGVSLALLSLSIIGISTPSFFLGMLLQIIELTAYKKTGIRLLPVGGFGWDSHLVLPVLVLAARPTAQVARLTFVRISEILNEDYIRTARAKGLCPRTIWSAHIIRNGANTVLTAMSTSLRFSLSSLPVVEVLFGWPGAGKAMLDMLRSSQRHGATVLLLIMGALFVILNGGLDLLYRVFDPRIREEETKVRSQSGWRDWLLEILQDVGSFLSLDRWRRRREASSDQARLQPLTSIQGVRAETTGEPTSPRDRDSQGRERMLTQRRARWDHLRRATIGNPALIMGCLIGVFLVILVIAGPSLARHNPYSPILTLTVDGEALRPPLAPSATYPFGTDIQGRDILSLLLTGARRTLLIAFFSVLARLFVGGVLGFLAGWFPDSRLDRAIMTLAETLSAFPALLLAMLLVFAIGIRQGMVAFVVALALIGWGEVMQTVRSQVMRIKPMAFIESATATGLSQSQILSAHVLPNIWPSMMSLAFLEMGGVLMILGELGFLGVFIGGGLGTDGEYGLPEVTYYDIPEWSVMLANSWRSFRSFPWATIYPALAFFIAISGFMFLGEGLRWLTERLTLSFRGLFNRYTLVALLLATMGTSWMLRTTNLYTAYAPTAKGYDAARAMSDLEQLSDPSLNGRLSGTADADRAADWIAREFESLGLLPGGDNSETFFQGYFQHLSANYRVLAAVPSLVLDDAQGQVAQVVRGRDYVEEIGTYDLGGVGRGRIVLVASGPEWIWDEADARRKYGIDVTELDRGDRVLLQVWPDAYDDGQSLSHVGALTMLPESGVETQAAQGSLMPGLQALSLQMPAYEALGGVSVPRFLISEALVRQMLPAGAPPLEDLVRISREGQESLYLPTAWRAELSMPTTERTGVPVRNVIAYWPGVDMLMDSDAVLVTAHYDGLGRFPDGTLYPGANDNASGVATLLETIRTLKEANYSPKRTIIFVAWTGAEFHQPADLLGFLEARIGFREAFSVIAALQIQGVGAGDGDGLVLEHATSERLSEVVRRAARRAGAPLSTVGSGLHADAALWPVPDPGVPSVTISWEGRDAMAHTPLDGIERIDVDKLAHAGRLTALSLMVLASDPAY